MKNILSGIDRWLDRLVTIFLGIAMISLTLIVNLQVVARYILKVSLGGLEELPVYLMIISVWIAAILGAKNDSHFKIDLLEMVIKNKRTLEMIRIVLKAVSLLVVCVLCVLSFKYVRGTKEMGDVTAGLAIPVWLLQSVIPFSTAFMAFYYAKQIFHDIKAANKWH